MPIQITCSRCGTVLAEFNDLPIESRLKHGTHKAIRINQRVSPQELVIKRNGGYCPNCGKKLETDANKQQVSVSPFNPYIDGEVDYRFEAVRKSMRACGKKVKP